MSFDTTLAQKLQAAFETERDRLPVDYERAVLACDEAWDGVEGAMSNNPPTVALAVEAITDFRAAYARKLALWNRVIRDRAA